MDSLLHATSCLQTPKNLKHRLDRWGVKLATEKSGKNQGIKN
ncbi:MAG: hypothetical protein SWX82_05345 [Cyanobacteriota bacterium]|nr:hypothetical protein [Cyanobacteriota bacterium]